MHVTKQHTTFSSLVYFCFLEFANFEIQPLRRHVGGFSFLAFIHSTQRPFFFHQILNF